MGCWNFSLTSSNVKKQVLNIIITTSGLQRVYKTIFDYLSTQCLSRLSTPNFFKLST